MCEPTCAHRWHDFPLELEGGLYNMLTEIPKVRSSAPAHASYPLLSALESGVPTVLPLPLTRCLHLAPLSQMSLKKMEVDTKAEGNPIKQDEKKGKARLYHGPIFWNYGCLPQTWEDPNVKGDADVGGAFGDDDPVDVVEIGAASLAMGSFTPVKALGCLSMIDDGELDWKVIAINAADEHAASINDVDDIEKFYPGTVSGIREWFRWYKTPDGKPINGFGHGEVALNAAKVRPLALSLPRRLPGPPHLGTAPVLTRSASVVGVCVCVCVTQTKEVIAETNGFYKKLIAGEAEAGKLWIPGK